MLYFIRHGQTFANLNNQLNGGENDGSLLMTDIARLHLNIKQLEGVKIDHIYCSTLLRARQTLSEIQRVQNYKDINVSYKVELIEQRFGELNNARIESLSRRPNIPHPSFVWRVENSSKGAETRVNFLLRLSYFLQDVSGYISNKEQHVLIVAHGGVYSGFRSLIYALGAEEVLADENEKIGNFEIRAF